LSQPGAAVRVILPAPDFAAVLVDRALCGRGFPELRARSGRSGGPDQPSINPNEREAGSAPLGWGAYRPQRLRSLGAGCSDRDPPPAGGDRRPAATRESCRRR